MLVYHYCSLESLNSILKHLALRLTNILKGSCMIRKLGLENILRSFSLFARHGRALTGVSPEHAQIVGSV